MEVEGRACCNSCACIYIEPLSTHLAVLRPDLTIYGNENNVQIFIENKFWADLAEAQPAVYLDHLPEKNDAALLFIVPEQRISTVWNELNSRCNSNGLEHEDASEIGEIYWIPKLFCLSDLMSQVVRKLRG